MSTKEFRDYILEQLAMLEGVTSRAMMGEYILYYRGKVIGGIYDNRLLVKPLDSARKLLPDAAYETPYYGAKKMLAVSDTDNKELLCELFEAIYAEAGVTALRR